MQFQLTLLLFLCSLLTRAQPARFSGTYRGDIQNTSSTLTLTQDAEQVSGEIDAQGYRYMLSCNAKGEACSGTLSDPQTNTQLPMTITLSGLRAIVSVRFSDPLAGEATLDYQFTRADATSSSQPAPKSEASISRDVRLVGTWLYTDSYTSGDFSMATQYRLIVNEDGTYLYGDGKVAGGGDAGSFSSDGGGYTQGQWKTENNMIYINEGAGWHPYCQYYVEGNSMMMTFNNGKRQLWKRY